MSPLLLLNVSQCSLSRALVSVTSVARQSRNCLPKTASIVLCVLYWRFTSQGHHTKRSQNEFK